MAKKQGQKASRGRSGALKVVPFNIRVAKEEKAAFARAAEVAGLPLSAWVRARLRTASLLELDNVGERADFVAPRKDH